MDEFREMPECCRGDFSHPWRMGPGYVNGASAWCRRCKTRWAMSGGVWVRWPLGEEKPPRDGASGIDYQVAVADEAVARYRRGFQFQDVGELAR